MDTRKGLMLAQYSRKKTRRRKKGKDNFTIGNKDKITPPPVKTEEDSGNFQVRIIYDEERFDSLENIFIYIYSV